MIDYKFGNYLSNYLSKSFEVNYSSHRRVAMVIVATKTSYWLPLVMKNALDKINQANLYFVGPPHCMNFVKETVSPNIKTIFVEDFHKIQNYNYLLLNEKFWNLFEEEFVFIFQPDCILLKDIDDELFNYDYIGAKCGNVTNQSTFTINGGLSLRRRTTMIEICKSLSPEEKSGIYAEDIMFTQKMREHSIFKNKLPLMDVCNKYFIEGTGDLDTAIGIHGTDKYYFFNDI